MAAHDTVELPQHVHGAGPVCVGSQVISLNKRRNQIADVIALRLSALMSQLLVFSGIGEIDFLFSATILKKCCYKQTAVTIVLPGSVCIYCRGNANLPIPRVKYTIAVNPCLHRPPVDASVSAQTATFPI